jgi:hypothetical protein
MAIFKSIVRKCQNEKQVYLDDNRGKNINKHSTMQAAIF